MYKNPGIIEFSGELIDAGGGGVYVNFPYNVETLFASKGRVPVQVKFEKKIDYAGSLVNMGTGNHIIIVLKNIREALNKKPGDQIKVSVWLDTAERKVQIPEDVITVFHKYVAAKKAFDKLSFSHQREYIQWITVAKKQTTRTSRIYKMIEKLNE